jgi:hypothetical protein
VADETFSIRQGDTLPEIRATVELRDGTAFDLTLVTEVAFRMSTQETHELLVDGVGEVIDATTGRLGYAWEAGDTDRAGTHHAVWVLTFTGERQMTVPNDPDEELLIEIMPQLG